MQIKSHRSRASRSAQSGSVLIEFVTVALLLFVTFVAVFDLCRIIAVKMVLLKGAHEGLSLAQKELYFRLDTRDLDLSNSEDYAKYQRLLNSRNRIISQAVRLPVNTLLATSDGIGAAKLKPFSYTDKLGAGSPVVVTGDALVLRPGESGMQGSVPVDHWTLCSPDSATCPADRRMPDFQTYREALMVHPIEVHVRADVTLLSGALFPGLSELMIEEKAAGWSEVPRNTLQVTDAPPPGSPPPTVTTTTTTATVTTTTGVSTTTLVGDTTTLPPATSTTLSVTTTTESTTTTLFECLGENVVPEAYDDNGGMAEMYCESLGKTYNYLTHCCAGTSEGNG